ncbi:MAG: hypothetical protein MJZ85_01560 [Bacteroidales bacterium]|nr:hypothetical protein [Bacteroidales bacterium]
MRRKVTLVSILTALIILVSGSFETISAQSKQLQKAKKKQVKEQLKKYKKEGWQVDGTTKSLEVALLEHYAKLEDENNRELLGTADGCESRNVCQNEALDNAMIKYAQEAKSHVMGRVNSEMGDVGEAELDNFYAAYERLVSSTIEGELRLSVSLYREKKDGKREYNSFFIVNEDQASKRRVKAMQNAAKESEAAQKFADQISDFVREGFEISEQ